MSTDPQFPLPPFPGQGGQPIHVQVNYAGESPVGRFWRELFTATPKIWVTKAIIAANFLVFALMVLSGGNLFEPSGQQMLRWGAGFGPLTTHGQPWRLFTEMFVHFGIIHIGMNMFVLWQGGQLVERLMGNFPYLVTYILSGLVGSFVSLFFHPQSLTGGASGAVFGIFGALFGFLLVQRGTVPAPILRSLFNSVGIFVVYNFIFAMMSKEVDLSAHGGGLVGGCILGALLSRKVPGPTNHWRAVTVAIIGGGLAIYLGLHLRPISLPSDF
jgi:rhomboid protease GluP